MKDVASDGVDDIYLSPIDVQTLADQATERLRNAIQRGSLGPGMQLVERDLAQRLGMSRVPIREAIQRLVEEGLVKKMPHRGTFVYLPSLREIEEISSVRVHLEHFVIERVLARWNPQHEATLQDIVEQIRTAATIQDRRRMSELDAQFHATLWDIADHQILLEVISSLRQRVTRLLHEIISLMPSEELYQAVESHEAVISVIKSGDVAAAKDEMTRHIGAARDRILSYYQRTFVVPGNGLSGNGLPGISLPSNGLSGTDLAADGLADNSNVLA
jgi:DNA-binding GntR family transcriptional regulator